MKMSVALAPRSSLRDAFRGRPRPSKLPCAPACLPKVEEARDAMQPSRPERHAACFPDVMQHCLRFRSILRAYQPTLVLLAGLAGCTTLGPMPAMTGVSAQPVGQPAVELQAAAVPGCYLSSSAKSEPEGTPLPQVSGVFEPDSLIGVRGLFAGARYAGSSGTGATVEPLLGYRAFLDEDERFGLGTVAYGTYASADRQGASFEAARAGLEAGAGVRLTPRSQWVEAHALAGASLTFLDTEGRYCVGPDERFAVDCPEAPESRVLVSGEAEGVYPAAHVSVALDFARHLRAPFHGARLAANLAGGTMPTVVSGQQRQATLFGSAGLSLTLGFGASR